MRFFKRKKKQVKDFTLELSADHLYSSELSLENQKNLEKFKKIYKQTRQQLVNDKVSFSKNESKFNSRFEHICLEGCKNLNVKKISSSPYKVNALPFEKGALKSRSLRKNLKSKSSKSSVEKNIFSEQSFKPFNLYTKPPKVIPASEANFTCVLSEKTKKLPEYWKKLKSPSKFSSTSLHREFSEKFSEYDTLHYSLDDGDFSMNFLKNQYFENHLSSEELNIPVNKELASLFNSLNKLLNEQPFLVLPIRPFALIYSLLPELDGIYAEFKKYKIDKSMKKRVSLKDVWVSGKGKFAQNLLSFAPSVSYFSTSLTQSLNRREWRSFAKVREFDINDFSLKCYSGMNPFTSSSNDRLLKLSEKLTRTIYWWGKFSSKFLISNNALEWDGSAPNFEKSVLMDKYEFTTFSQPSIYWAKEYQNSLQTKASIRFSEQNKF